MTAVPRKSPSVNACAENVAAAKSVTSARAKKPTLLFKTAFPRCEPPKNPSSFKQMTAYPPKALIFHG
jgi:hypothetical protein